MGTRFTTGQGAVMTGTAGTAGGTVIHVRWNPGHCQMAVAAVSHGCNVGARFARGLGAIVAGGTVANDACVIHAGRQPGIGSVAIITG